MGSVVGVAYSLAAVGAMISPLFTGAIADRFFSSQKVLAVLHVASGLILFAVTPLVSRGNSALFLAAIFIYMLFFQPTLTMTNNIAFTHIPEKSNAFAHIRAFGTAGWIIIGLFIGQSGLSASTAIFTIAAIMSLVLAVYSLTLPNTPPPARGNRFQRGDVVGAGAFSLFRQRSFTALVVCLLLAAVPISIYNSYGSTYLNVVGVPNVASFMTIGQATEIVFLALLPAVLKRFSMKTVLVSGLIAWVIRAVVLLVMTGGNVSLAIVVVALHGICSDFFIMASFMYVLSNPGGLQGIGIVDRPDPGQPGQVRVRAVSLNYHEYPDWSAKVLETTDGRGVDHVVDVGGSGPQPTRPGYDTEWVSLLAGQTSDRHHQNLRCLMETVITRA